MENDEKNITREEFKSLCKFAENIYNITIVINYFVENQPHIEELYNLTPIVRLLKNESDLLNMFFINKKNQHKK